MSSVAEAPVAAKTVVDPEVARREREEQQMKAEYEKQKGSPPVGWPILWYPFADRKGEPWPGVVCRVLGMTQLTVNVFPIGGGVIQCHKNVYHCDSQELKDRPQLATTHGGWDWVTGLVFVQAPLGLSNRAVDGRMAQQHSKGAIEAQQKHDAQVAFSENEKDTERALAMHREGKSTRAITTMLGRGWTFERVEQLIRNHMPSASNPSSPAAPDVSDV